VNTVHVATEDGQRNACDGKPYVQQWGIGAPGSKVYLCEACNLIALRTPRPRDHGASQGEQAIVVYSASLPLAVNGYGEIVAWPDVRPWNGRRLTDREVWGAVTAARLEYGKTKSYGLASQAAFEWLSEHAA